MEYGIESASLDAALARLPCAFCPSKVPARMEPLLLHARTHHATVAASFPLRWSPEAEETLHALVEDTDIVEERSGDQGAGG